VVARYNLDCSIIGHPLRAAETKGKEAQTTTERARSDSDLDACAILCVWFLHQELRRAAAWAPRKPATNCDRHNVSSRRVVNRVERKHIVTTVTLQEAQVNLPSLLEQLCPGQEITITDHGQPLARLKKAERTSWPCKAGSYKKTQFRMAPDFDAPLGEFKEYME
jgi:antitoxin (DNA-binding transcriptional repressor) of toxin-antitoxin stability system